MAVCRHRSIFQCKWLCSSGISAQRPSVFWSSQKIRRHRAQFEESDAVTAVVFLLLTIWIMIVFPVDVLLYLESFKYVRC